MAEYDEGYTGEIEEQANEYVHDHFAQIDESADFVGSSPEYGSTAWFLNQLEAEGAMAGEDFNDGDEVMGYFGWSVDNGTLEVWHEPDEGKRIQKRFVLIEVLTPSPEVPRNEQAHAPESTEWSDPLKAGSPEREAWQATITEEMAARDEAYRMRQEHGARFHVEGGPRTCKCMIKNVGGKWVYPDDPELEAVSVIEQDLAATEQEADEQAAWQRNEDLGQTHHDHDKCVINDD